MKYPEQASRQRDNGRDLWLLGAGGKGGWGMTSSRAGDSVWGEESAPEPDSDNGARHCEWTKCH